MQPISQVISRSMTSGSNPLRQMKLIQHYCCMKCRGEVKVARIKVAMGPNKGDVVEQKLGCNCEIIERIRSDQEKARKARLHTIFEEHSLINPALKDATFENFETGEFGKALDQAKRFAQGFDLKQPRNLFFQGTFGTGKSHLSVAITKAVTQKGFSTIFISTPKLLTKIRNTYNKGSHQTEEQVLSAINRADLVVFDDIGAEGDISGWGMQKIFEVIDQRAGKHNVYTTNLSSDEFSASKDLHRIFSRMMMNAEPVVMNGTDYRMKQFLKGAKENG